MLKKFIKSIKKKHFFLLYKKCLSYICNNKNQTKVYQVQELA